MNVYIFLWEGSSIISSIVHNAQWGCLLLVATSLNACFRGGSGGVRFIVG